MVSRQTVMDRLWVLMGEKEGALARNRVLGLPLDLEDGGDLQGLSYSKSCSSLLTSAKSRGVESYGVLDSPC